VIDSTFCPEELEPPPQDPAGRPISERGIVQGVRPGLSAAFDFDLMAAPARGWIQPPDITSGVRTCCTACSPHRTCLGFCNWTALASQHRPRPMDEVRQAALRIAARQGRPAPKQPRRRRAAHRVRHPRPGHRRRRHSQPAAHRLVTHTRRPRHQRTDHWRTAHRPREARRTKPVRDRRRSRAAHPEGHPDRRAGPERRRGRHRIRT